MEFITLENKNRTVALYNSKEEGRIPFDKAHITIPEDASLFSWNRIRKEL